MPSGAKKRRSLNRKKTAAIENTKNATAVSPKRVVLEESMLSPCVIDVDDKNNEVRKENLLPTEIYSIVPASEYLIGTNQADEVMLLQLMYLNRIHKTMTECGWIMSSDDTTSSLLTDNEMISLTPDPCHLDLVAVVCSDSDDADLNNAHVTEDQRTCAHKEDYNVETASMIEVDGAEKTVQHYVVEAAANDKLEAAIADEFNDNIEENILEAVTATKPAADVVYRSNDAVLTEPEILKQLQTIKEIVKNVLNRINAIDAQLHKV